MVSVLFDVWSHCHILTPDITRHVEQNSGLSKSDIFMQEYEENSFVMMTAVALISKEWKEIYREAEKSMR